MHCRRPDSGQVESTRVEKKGVSMGWPFRAETPKANPNGLKDYDPLLSNGNLSRNGGRMPGPQLERNWSTEGFAKALIAVVDRCQDDFARAIFQLWLSGNAPSEVVFESPEWSKYMQADPWLEAQIIEQLEQLAENLRGEVDMDHGKIDRKFLHQFHAAVGKPDGGYNTGYTLLHGSNETVGDMQISGRIVVNRKGDDGEAYGVTFKNLQFQFNDVIDPNFKYKSDEVFRDLFVNVARVTGANQPKDYILRIKWSIDLDLTFQVGSRSSMAGSLRQFENF
jgi:hypothetical protein